MWEVSLTLRCAQAEAEAAGSDGLHSLDYSPKLLALRQILHECGIGAAGPATTDDADGNVTRGDDALLLAPHRALVFCQVRLIASGRCDT